MTCKVMTALTFLMPLFIHLGYKNRWDGKEKYFMPFYEYQCKDCGQCFEQLVSISEASHKQVCPRCGSKNTEKQLSVFAAKSSLSSGSGASGGGGFT
jgi:putative FmdB family regulatory protein